MKKYSKQVGVFWLIVGGFCALSMSIALLVTLFNGKIGFGMGIYFLVAVVISVYTAVLGVRSMRASSDSVDLGTVLIPHPRWRSWFGMLCVLFSAVAFFGWMRLGVNSSDLGGRSPVMIHAFSLISIAHFVLLAIALLSKVKGGEFMNMDDPEILDHQP